MVGDELTDGRRIAQLLASEIAGHEDPPLAGLAVADADRDAVATPDGTFAYEVRLHGDVAGAVFVHDDRARLDLRDGLDAARAAAETAGLRARPTAGEPPRLLVFVESGAEVKRALDVLAAVADAA